MSEITHIEMYADIEVTIISYQANGENWVTLNFPFGSEVRHSILGNMLTIENCKQQETELDGEVKLPSGTVLKLKSIRVMGTGSLFVDASDANRKLSVKVFNSGDLTLRCDTNGVFAKLQLSNHGSGKIKGDGNTTEVLKIQNTGSGTISGFLVEKELVALISGSGHTTIDKFSNCLTHIKKIPTSTGKLTFI